MDNAIFENLEPRMFLSAGTELHGHATNLSSSKSPSLSAARVQYDEYGNTDASATYFLLSSTGTASISGQINYAGDVDVFSVAPTKNGKMTINLKAASSKTSTGIKGDISVYVNGIQIARNTTGSNALSLSFDVTANVRYYIHIASTGNEIGKYTATVAAAWTVPPPSPTPGSYIPGTTISWQMIDGSLVVLGTDNADAITVSESVGNTVIYANGIKVLDTIDVFANISLYGFGGDDTLVTISGDSEYLYGGTGLDSYWVDGLDSIYNIEAAEAAVKSSHVVYDFLQPTSENVSLELSGQKISDPITTVNGYPAGNTIPYPYANFSYRPLFVNGPQYNDIKQGSIGDCYFMAALASLAQSDPGIIKQMIAPLGDGTYAVRYFRGGQEVIVRIDADLPVFAGDFLAYAGSVDKEIWVGLVEKAYAQFRTGANSYASISGGWMSEVYAQVTGSSYTSLSISSTTNADTLATRMYSELQAGHAVSAGTSVGNAYVARTHAYMVQSVQQVNNIWMVTVFNPWGQDGTDIPGDTNRYDGLITMTISQFTTSFIRVDICNF